jgi:DNA gyrase subunit A
LTREDYYIMMAVKSGRAICFPQEKVRATGRGAIGVFGIELNDGNDEVIGMICVAKDDINKQVLVVSEKGLGKRTPFLERVEKADNGDKAEQLAADEPYNLVTIGDDKYLLSYRVTNRGGKGVKTINITEKTGALVGLVGVEETDDLMITCESGVTIRMKVSAIREAGRATQGVKLINIDEGDKIAAIARIAEQDTDADENTDSNGTAAGNNMEGNDAITDEPTPAEE